MDRWSEELTPLENFILPVVARARQSFMSHVPCVVGPNENL